MKIKHKNIRCSVCGYEWFTNSSNKHISCPHCGANNLNPNYDNPKVIKEIGGIEG